MPHWLTLQNYGAARAVPKTVHKRLQTDYFHSQNMNTITQNRNIHGMKDKFMKGSVIINITGGNNQILPHAVHATQNFFGDQFAPEQLCQEVPVEADVPVIVRESCHPQSSELSDNAVRLRKYVDTDENLRIYLQQIQVCETATALAQVVVNMEQQERNLLRSETTKERFIRLVLSLAPNIQRGNTVNNLRARIYDAQQRKNKK